MDVGSWSRCATTADDSVVWPGWKWFSMEVCMNSYEVARGNLSARRCSETTAA
jgi:hypothetical protein